MQQLPIPRPSPQRREPVERATRRFPLRKWVAVVLVSLPRVPLGYPFFATACLLFANPLAILQLVAPFIFALATLFGLALLRWTVSPTAHFIELALLLPIMAAVFAAHRVKPWINPGAFMRSLNAAAMLLSIGNMAVTQGFPLRLPYIDFVPDYYGALYFLGGARIVTMIGFFGLFNELLRGTKRRKRSLLIALVNFIVPSSLIVTAIGIAALALMQVRRMSATLVLALAIVLPSVAGYALYRDQTENNVFEAKTGESPKVFAYTNLANLWMQDPASIVFGVGPGQYASEAAQWVLLAGPLTTSSHVNLPGLFTPGPSRALLLPKIGPFLSNSYILGSSKNKPFASLSTMLAEWGVPLTFYFMLLLTRAVSRAGGGSMASLSLLAFIYMSFAVDQWHDDPWFGTLLFVTLLNLHRWRAWREGQRRQQRPARAQRKPWPAT